MTVPKTADMNIVNSDPVLHNVPASHRPIEPLDEPSLQLELIASAVCRRREVDRGDEFTVREIVDAIREFCPYPI